MNEITETQPFDPAELTDAELEAITAGKQPMARLMSDTMIFGLPVKMGLLPPTALQSRAFRRQYGL